MSTIAPGRYVEATARERVRGFFDAGSVHEWLGPTKRVSSPHLPALDLPVVDTLDLAEPEVATCMLPSPRSTW